MATIEVEFRAWSDFHTSQHIAPYVASVPTSDVIPYEASNHLTRSAQETTHPDYTPVPLQMPHTCYRTTWKAIHNNSFTRRTTKRNLNEKKRPFVFPGCSSIMSCTIALPQPGLLGLMPLTFLLMVSNLAWTWSLDK